MLFDRVGQLYEARLTEQAATVAAKDEMIAELRRRAEAAEAERDTLRARLEAAQAVPAGADSLPPPPPLMTRPPPPPLRR